MHALPAAPAAEQNSFSVREIRAPNSCLSEKVPATMKTCKGCLLWAALGKLLTQMIEAMGLTRDEVYICNVVKCVRRKTAGPKTTKFATTPSWRDCGTERARGCRRRTDPARRSGISYVKQLRAAEPQRDSQ